MTPFLALYGRDPPTIPRYKPGSSLVNEVDRNLATRDAILRDLKIHLSRSVHQMKQVADKKRRDVEFFPGDFVYLKLQPYRQQSVSKRAFQKLACRFYGPYLVEEKIGKLAYRLQLPAESRVHPVFHVSLLKKYVGDAAPISSDIPQLTDDGYFVFEPTVILDTRWVRIGNRFTEESLVQWTHLPKEDATWEVTADLSARFPHLNLEDKVHFEGEGTDRPLRRTSRVIIKNRKYLD